jgi:hypothetical protein
MALVAVQPLTTRSPQPAFTEVVSELVGRLAELAMSKLRMRPVFACHTWCTPVFCPSSLCGGSEPNEYWCYNNCNGYGQDVCGPNPCRGFCLYQGC